MIDGRRCKSEKARMCGHAVSSNPSLPAPIIVFLLFSMRAISPCRACESHFRLPNSLGLADWTVPALHDVLRGATTEMRAFFAAAPVGPFPPRRAFESVVEAGGNVM